MKCREVEERCGTHVPAVGDDAGDEMSIVCGVFVENGSLCLAPLILFSLCIVVLGRSVVYPMCPSV